MNLAIKNAHWDLALEKALFNDEHVNHIQEGAPFDMFDLLVVLGVFPSKGQARKNWKATGKDFPPGFNHFVIGKMKHKVWIWNPVPSPE